MPAKKQESLAKITTLISDKVEPQCSGDKYSQACQAIEKMKAGITDLGVMLAKGETDEKYWHSEKGIAELYCLNRKEILGSASSLHDEKQIVDLTGVVNLSKIYNSGKNVIELGKRQDVLASRFEKISGRKIDATKDCMAH